MKQSPGDCHSANVNSCSKKQEQKQKHRTKLAIDLEQGSANSVKGQTGNMLSVTGHPVSDTATQLGRHGAKAAIGNTDMNACGWAPIKLVTDTEIGISCNFHVTNVPLWFFLNHLKM